VNRKERRTQESLGRGAPGPGQPPGAPGPGALAQAIAAFNSGKFREARALLEPLIARNPDDAETLNVLGAVCQESGDAAAAIAHFKKAQVLRPNSADIVNHLGMAELHAHDVDAAQQCFERAIALNPNLAIAHHNLGLIHKHRREWDPAIQSFGRAIALAPGNLGAHVGLAETLLDSGRLDEALPYYRRLAATAPNVVDVQVGLASALRNASEFEDAAIAARRAIALDPRSVEAHIVLASILTILGPLDEATAEMKTALSLRPDSAEALYGIVSTSKDYSNQELAGHIETLLESERPRRDRLLLHFALGKIYDDLGNYAKAFENYKKGNDLALLDKPFDAAQNARNIERHIAVFTPAFFATHHGLGSTSRRPVFIFGMPRSGTTLVEQIIASHPLAAAGGELKAIADLTREMMVRRGDLDARYPESLAPITEAEARWLQDSYLGILENVDRDAARVTDKMPANFMHLGIMTSMFPQATFIHCRRNPMDTCLSCYFAKFLREMDFSFRLEDIGAYYRGYRRLMDHWRKVLPVFMLEIDYEELISDQEAVSRRIIARCGLEWDNACLAFHKTERPVATASQWQVRQPVYRTSVERWRRYEPFLGPLRAALGEDAGA
jgi:tetratricopeptide (TPR) repeat protein